MKSESFLSDTDRDRGLEERENLLVIENEIEGLRGRLHTPGPLFSNRIKMETIKNLRQKFPPSTNTRSDAFKIPN